MYGVKLGEKHSYNDLDLILNSKSILAPSAKINTIDIPGGDGGIDLTEILTGDVKYSNRKIKCEFTFIGKYRNFLTKWSELQNILHGKRMKVIFDDDAYYYYEGRIELNEWKSDKSLGKISLEVDAEPYKLEFQTSAEDWIWDSFNFETGVIRELKNLNVNGTREVVVVGSEKKSTPTIYASADMKVTFNNATYVLYAGINKLYDILITNTENKLKFTGNGTVTIEYRGGAL